MSTPEVGQLIDYRFIRTSGVHSGYVQYIDDEKIKLSGPPAGEIRDYDVQKRKQKSKNKGSWYWLEELEILSD